jgi:O-antigen/teichoic acid export membrane protein
MNATRATDVELAELPGVQPLPWAGKSLTHRILSGGAWSIAGRLGSLGSLFLMNIVLARYLPTADFSAYLAAASVMPFLAMLACAGIPFTVVRALRGQISGPQDRTAILRGAIVVTLAGSALTTVAVYLTASAIPAEPKWYVLRHCPGLMSAWFTLSALAIVCACFMQGVDDFRTAAMLGARNGGLIPNMISLIVVAMAAAFGMLTLTLVMSSQVAGYVAALIVAAMVVPPLLNRFRFDEPIRRESAEIPGRRPALYSAGWYFRESWPNLINQLITVALVELDLFWVACLAPESVVAEYGIVRNLRLLVTAPLLIASVSLAPFVAELYGRGDLARLERMLRGTTTIMAVPSLVALAACLFVPELIIRLTFGAKFVAAAPALSVASLGCIIFVISGSNGLVLTMTGRHRDLMVCSFIGLGLYLAISPWMIARYGVLGAAAAFTIQIVIQNIIVTLRVKQAVGVWTIPLLSPAAVIDEAVQLRRRLAAR